MVSLLIGKRQPTLLISGLLIAVFFFVGLWHQEVTMERISYQFAKTLKLGNSSRHLTFYEIAKKYGTDKINPHHYERMYSDKFEPIRNKNLKMLEIGLGCDQTYGPGASYYTWLDYFPHVQLYFIEFDAACALQWANSTIGATIITGDQSDPVFLESFIEETGGDFDIIVDDGGHTMTQQKTSLAVLWDAVKPGGVYFVEDLATSYMGLYSGRRKKRAEDDSFMTVVKMMMDDINIAPEKGNPGSEWHAISAEVFKIDFTQECIGFTKKLDA